MPVLVVDGMLGNMTIMALGRIVDTYGNRLRVWQRIVARLRSQGFSR